MPEDRLSRSELQQTMDALKNATSPPLTDDSRMPLGKYAGKLMKDVPVAYLEWMVTEMNNYPRVDRSKKWMAVIEWVKGKKG